MNELLTRLLQLRTLHPGDEGVSLRFAHPLPAWVWGMIVTAMALYAGWSYWRLLGSRGARAGLAVLRTLMLLLLCVLAAGPQLVRQNERVERDWVVVMADRSASMTVQDAPGAGGTLVARETQLRGALHDAAPALEALAKDRNVLYEGFDQNAFDLRSAAELGEPEGRRTLLGQAIDQTLRRVAARPVSGIVVLSDGRSADSVGRATLRQLGAKQIPVFVVPLGSKDPIPDLAISRVDAPAGAFVGDIVPVTARIERLGGGGVITGKVRLVDGATGAVLDERPIPADNAEVTLQSRPETPGTRDWAVRIVPDTRDLSAENNTAPVRISLVDRPIRVLYFDGYPRWEYRYLKNLLLREKSVRSSIMLLASDRKYIQEGTDILGSVPRSREDWRAFDVVIVGDLRPSLFSEDQLTELRNLVAERGAGLLWIGGPGATPQAWRGTALGELLPFAGGSDGQSGAPAWSTPVMLMPGPAARQYGVLNLGDSPGEWPGELENPSLGWPMLQWAQRIDVSSLKPTAEVIAMARPSAGTESGSPLVMTMRYGAGRVVYVGTDETWRYRYGKGETLQERFWLPLVRLLARESLGRLGKPALLTASPERAEVGQQVLIRLRLLDQTLMDKKPREVSVRIVRTGGSRAGEATTVTLRPDGSEGESGETGSFVGLWPAGEPGTFSVEGADPLLAGLDLSARVDVTLPDDELRSPQADHASLEALAGATGGAVVAPGELSKIGSLLPNRQVKLLGTPEVETLWDKPLAWTALMVLLAVEWMGRRLIKLG